MCLKISLVLFVCTFLSFAQESRYSNNGYQTAIKNAHLKNLLPSHISKTNSNFWTELSPKIPQDRYNCIDFVNADNGWAVGKNEFDNMFQAVFISIVLLQTPEGGYKYLIENCL
ncbi:hypothetical protein ACFLSH_01930 [Bacteroidota bacterium]